MAKCLQRGSRRVETKKAVAARVTAEFQRAIHW
jgi:hypothetical protein